MARRIYIIPASEAVTPEVVAQANLEFCSEIASGIPPKLANVIFENELPCVYNEDLPPNLLSLPPLIDWKHEWLNAGTTISERLKVIARRLDFL